MHFTLPMLENHFLLVGLMCSEKEEEGKRQSV